MMSGFKAFVLRGNVLDLAVGVIIGAAFGTIVNSFVSDVMMPPIGVLVGGVDFSNLFFVIKEGAAAGPYATLAAAKAAGAVTVNYGAFITNVINFLIIAFSVYLVIQAVGKWAAKLAPAEEKK